MREILTLRYSGRRWDRAGSRPALKTQTPVISCCNKLQRRTTLQIYTRLFSDPTTFAVSRQPCYRLWHPTIIATAPFRQLQPGTATAIIAPISPSILIDRAKLVALGGLPDTIVPGSALLLLFWKAAAGRLDLYSEGSSRPSKRFRTGPTKKRNSLYESFRPSLKRLGPQDPGRKRGNITFHARESPTDTPDRPRILVVSPSCRFRYPTGGQSEIIICCRTLSARADLLLASFREATDHIHFDKLLLCFPGSLRGGHRRKALSRPTLPGQVRGHLSKSMRALVAWLCETRAVDILQIEFTHLAHFRDASPGLRLSWFSNTI